jgi:predicted  nucleic acid-binding Zn-ribbon protein
VDVAPIANGVTNRLLCLGCRNVFGATALRDTSGCPGCGNPSFLRLRGPGAFSVLRLDQAAPQETPSPRKATP